MEKVKVGIIGSGFAANLHARAYFSNNHIRNITNYLYYDDGGVTVEFIEE